MRECHIGNSEQTSKPKMSAGAHGGVPAAGASAEARPGPSRKNASRRAAPSGDPTRRVARFKRSGALGQPMEGRSRARVGEREARQLPLRRRLALADSSRQPCAAGFLELIANASERSEVHVHSGRLPLRAAACLRGSLRRPRAFPIPLTPIPAGSFDWLAAAGPAAAAERPRQQQQQQQQQRQEDRHPRLRCAAGSSRPTTAATLRRRLPRTDPSRRRKPLGSSSSGAAVECSQYG